MDTEGNIEAEAQDREEQVMNTQSPHKAQTKEVLAFIHEKGLEILDFLHEVCEKEGLTYSLAYGTMLGAVRHAGIIPWDDDIDVFMTRENYDRLWEVLPRYNNPDIWGVYGGKHWLTRLTYRTPPIFEGEHILNINVDIWVLDKIPKTEKEKKKFFRKIRMYQGMIKQRTPFKKEYSLKAKLLTAATGLMGKFQREKSMCKRHNRLGKKYQNSDSDKYFCSNGHFYYLDFIHDGSWIRDTIFMPFEGRNFRVYAGYENMLRMFYGDYMELPPEEERKPSHIRKYPVGSKPKGIKMKRLKRRERGIWR